MQLFYNSELKASDKHFYFNKNESRHILKVLRKNIGDNIQITNGLGVIFEAEIVTNNQNKCEVSIINTTVIPAKEYSIHLAVAPTKMNDRYEWFLEKATEIGIDQITPIICARSERKIIKPERYEKIIQAAAKQSLRAHFPILNPAVHFTDFIKNTTDKHRYIAHCLEHNQPHLKDLITPKKSVLILIGPEGDFTIDEINLAQASDIESVNLGNARLRTETAAVVACHITELCNA